MAFELPNGAVVSRFYSGTDTEGELLAVFQYASDADEWCAAKVASDFKHGSTTRLIRTCLYSGKAKAFRPTEEA